jgi:hypothetical protein
MDFIKKHRSHSSGIKRCIRYFERKRHYQELKQIKDRFDRGGEGNVRVKDDKRSS